MKKLLILLFITISIPAFAQQGAKNASQKAVYTCPMHPEVISDKPGRCPKCGMYLVKKATPAKKPQSRPAAKPVAKPKVRPSAQPQKKEVQQKEVLENESAEKPAEKIETPARAQSEVKSAYKPKRKRYDLFIRDSTVQFTDKKRHAIAINGRIPGPVLEFTKGDTAEIHVHNMLKVETSVHWHGVFLPNKFDGVPYLTQMPIAPGQSYVYKFPVIQDGTYWYHSHTGLQEQSGMYGALIFNKPDEPEIPTIPVVLSEWADMKPKEIDRRLHNASDWFAVKKNTVQSYAEAIQAGHLGTKLTNEWKRMHAMDVSDVAYDAFLVNGAVSQHVKQFKGGDRVRLRIVNGGASSYFWMTYSGGKISVVANDGNDVEPVEVDRLIIAPSETYDVIVTLPESMKYEFLFTPEDRTSSASLWLGDGMEMPAEPLPRLDYFPGMKMMNAMMDNSGNMKSMGMQMSNQTMDMNEVMYPEMDPEKKTATTDHSDHQMNGEADDQSIVTLNYGMLRSTQNTTLGEGPLREMHFELTGNMDRYVWTIDNKTVSESDKILIRKGENLRITMTNNSMMRHPMHLHGHDFRVINGQGEFAPLKNVIDIMPMETDTIEFAATESGDWFFHCHILYHMMSGMGRIFTYEGSEPNPEIKNPKYAERKLFADDRMFHFMFENDFATNGNDGMAMLANTRWQINSEWRLGYHDKHGYEVETHIGRYLGRMQWLMPFIGFDWRYRSDPMDLHGQNIFGQENKKDQRSAFSIGAEYTLPMLVKLTGEVYLDGIVRFQLKREDIPISRRLRMHLMVNTDREYMAGLKFIAGKFFAPSIHYDSDMGLGAGVTFMY